MAIGTPALVGSAGTNTGTATATASFTPTANDRLFAWVFARNGSAYVNPGVTDSVGLTWNQVGGDWDGPASNAFVRARLYWADVGASPVAMTVTATAASSNPHGVTVIRVPMGANPDTVNVSSGTSATGDPSATITGTPGAALSFVIAQASNLWTLPTGYTLLTNVALATNNFRTGAVYDLSSPATTASWFSTNVNSVTVLLELKELAVVGATYTLTADGGSFALTGAAAALKATRQLVAASVSFALTGTATTLKAARNLAAASASFALTGQDATLTYTPAAGAYVLEAGVASFALTGSPATLTKTDSATHLHGRRKPRGRIVRFADEFEPVVAIPTAVEIAAMLPASLRAEVETLTAQVATLAQRIERTQQEQRKAAQVAALSDEMARIEAAIAEMEAAEAAYWTRLREEDEFFLLAA